MGEDLRDRAAGDLVSLMPLYHRHIFRPGGSVSGIHVARYRMLGLLIKKGPLSMSEIGRFLYVSKPSMTALADSLIDDGLVERRRDPADRRVINIAITPKGKKYVTQFFASFKSSVKTLLADLDDKDVNDLCRSLADLRRILEKIP